MSEYRLVVPENLGVVSATELDGATIALLTGADMETTVNTFFQSNNISYEPIPAVSLDEAVQQFRAGAADVLVIPEAGNNRPVVAGRVPSSSRDNSHSGGYRDLRYDRAFRSARWTRR